MEVPVLTSAWEAADVVASKGRVRKAVCWDRTSAGDRAEEIFIHYLECGTLGRRNNASNGYLESFP